MKIKKLFQQIFKKFFQFIFKLYYGKLELTEINSAKLEINQIKFIRLNKNNYLVDKKIYKIINARIYTDLVE